MTKTSGGVISPHAFSVAPMMDWTDRHCRFFHRLFTRRAVLYTEMLTPEALIHNPNRARFLEFSPVEKPLVLQLGGSDPDKLREAVRIAEDYDYDEYNLNVGCPSDRVLAGKFGAILMNEPDLVAKCVLAMRSVTDKPITVKNRIGLDDQNSEIVLRDFIKTVKEEGGVKHFIIHARKAILKGLCPKENRTVPPLNYNLVYAIKQENPELTVSVNGGFLDLVASKNALNRVDGVMVGRAAYQTPDILQNVDLEIYGEENANLTDDQINQAMASYAEVRMKAGTPLKSVVRHTLGWGKGKPGARLRRQILSEEANKPGASPELFLKAAKGERLY